MVTHSRCHLSPCHRFVVFFYRSCLRYNNNIDNCDNPKNNYRARHHFFRRSFLDEGVGERRVAHVLQMGLADDVDEHLGLLVAGDGLRKLPRGVVSKSDSSPGLLASAAGLLVLLLLGWRQGDNVTCRITGHEGDGFRINRQREQFHSRWLYGVNKAKTAALTLRGCSLAAGGHLGHSAPSSHFSIAREREAEGTPILLPFRQDQVAIDLVGGVLLKIMARYGMRAKKGLGQYFESFPLPVPQEIQMPFAIPQFWRRLHHR